MKVWTRFSYLPKDGPRKRLVVYDIDSKGFKTMEEIPVWGKGNGPCDSWRSDKYETSKYWTNEEYKAAKEQGLIKFNKKPMRLLHRHALNVVEFCIILTLAFPFIVLIVFPQHLFRYVADFFDKAYVFADKVLDVFKSKVIRIIDRFRRYY